MKTYFLGFLLLLGFSVSGQYSFTGQLADKAEGKTVYLSLIEDYRKLSRINFDQVIGKSVTDSLGNFSFEGNQLSAQNRIYRIHIDLCEAASPTSDHFMGSCTDIKSVKFIANNHDSVRLPTSFADEVFCEISSTNPKAELLLKIDALKEEMAFDFSEIRSKANTRLNLKKWFSEFQEFGATSNEPLAELYIYEFLSDKRNETYEYYLNDISKNPYYEALADRLYEQYPEAPFTKLYKTELQTDQYLYGGAGDDQNMLIWILAGLLLTSLVINFMLFQQKRKSAADTRLALTEDLTKQEKKIVEQIIADKTNKEIATALFISPSTVKTHINNLYRKLDVKSREEVKTLFQR